MGRLRPSTPTDDRKPSTRQAEYAPRKRGGVTAWHLKPMCLLCVCLRVKRWEETDIVDTFVFYLHIANNL